ncbi:MAG: hypothetical protein ACR2JX_09670, partial [Mycobacteriales bacterium]
AEGPDFFFVTSFSVMGSHGTFPAEPPGPANQTQNTLKYTDPSGVQQENGVSKRRSDNGDGEENGFHAKHPGQAEHTPMMLTQDSANYCAVPSPQDKSAKKHRGNKEPHRHLGAVSK